MKIGNKYHPFPPHNIKQASEPLATPPLSPANETPSSSFSIMVTIFGKIHLQFGNGEGEEEEEGGVLINRKIILVGWAAYLSLTYFFLQG